ncbi:MAG: thermonuclease family protein [Candidatus Methanosuratus sp.]|nr:thermonuclease family protein [Candidatus Methanosuratincola sp.]
MYRKRVVFTTVVILGALLVCSMGARLFVRVGEPPPTVALNAQTETTDGTSSLVEAAVVKVIDGDTIEVLIDGRVHRVRYIGIDAPETVHSYRPAQTFGVEAAARNEELVGGRTVLLEKDISETDRYGRLLRYVWLDDILINEALVRDGYAQSFTYPPDVKYQDRLDRAEKEARAAGRGLWRTEEFPNS